MFLAPFGRRAMAMRTRGLGVVAVTMMWLLTALPATAQESRLEVLAGQRAEKAQTLQPHEPNLAERVLDAMKNFPMLSEHPHGVYPLFGGMIDGAGWLKVGAAHRRNFGDAGQHVVSYGRVSNRGYWQVGGNVELPEVVRGRLAMRLDTSHLHARDVSFYGLGNDSSVADDPAAFRMDATTAGLSGTLRTVGHLSVGGRTAYDQVTTTASSLGDPALGAIVGLDSAPGFDSTTRYLHNEAFVDLDWRESPGYTRSGGQVRLGMHRFTQVDGSESSFTRVDAEVSQHVPFLNGRRVVAVRGLVTMTAVGAGQAVPHFLLPYVGGRNSVRSLPSYRFQDRHLLLFNAEYRWRASEAVDMALFADAGKVAATRDDLDLRGLHRSAGIGLRLHGTSFTAVRLEAAYGTDGLRFLFAVGPVF